MATWFISRHTGAIEWAKQQKLPIDHWVPHLDVDAVQSGDTVIGTLPVNLAAQVCAKGAHFVFLVMNLRADQRGRELSPEEMAQAGCSLAEYEIMLAE